LPFAHAPARRRTYHQYFLGRGIFFGADDGLYAASKHALEGASEALCHELRPWNIKVSIIQPGFVTSEAYESTRLGLALETGKRSAEGRPAYDRQSRTISALVESAVKLSTATPVDVAKAIYHVIQMKNPPLRHKVTLDAQVFGFLKKFLPERTFEKLVCYCLDKLNEQILPLAPNALVQK